MENKVQCAWCKKWFKDLLEWDSENEDLGWCSNDCIMHAEDHGIQKSESEMED